MCWGNSLNSIDEKVRCLLEILDDSVLCCRDEDVLGDMLREDQGIDSSELCSETTVTS